MNTQVKFEEAKTQAFTTLREYDNAVRLSQRKLKALNERLEANPLDSLAQQQKKLAAAAHKFLLASRAKFKEATKQTVQALDRGAEPGKLFTPEGERALDELARMIGTKRESAASVDIGGDIMHEREPVIFEGKENHIGITRVDRKPTAAEPQAPVPVDHSREFVPRARVIRERAHAGVMLHRPKYAADDSRHFGLGYKNVHRKGEQWRRTVALAVTPKFPSERGFMLRACKGGQGIMVNGRPWP